MSLIPATILTGFLGSGKTTLLKRVLGEAHGQKIAVIENEFGEENIDNEILVSDTQEQIIQMSNGCICCTIREDLRATLRDLAEKKRKGELHFDRVVIETTGVADPGPVAPDLLHGRRNCRKLFARFHFDLGGCKTRAQAAR
jgi:G3E family GTPase